MRSSGFIIIFFILFYRLLSKSHKTIKIYVLKLSKIRINIKLIFIFLLIFIKIFKWTKIKIITKNKLSDIKLEYNLKILIKEMLSFDFKIALTC